MSKSIENVQAIKAELENPANDGVLLTGGVVFDSVVEQAKDHEGKVIGVVGLSKVEEGSYSTPVTVEEIEDGVFLLTQDADHISLTTAQAKGLRDALDIILGAK